MISFHNDKFEYKPKPLITYEEDEDVISLMKFEKDSEEWDKAISDWLDKKQKEVDRSESKYSRLKYNVDIVNFYVKIELYVEAKLYAEDAWGIIHNEMRNDDSEELATLCKNLDYLNDLLDEMI